MSRLEVDVELKLGAFELRARLASDARALGLFGASGAGKTSLAECLAGWRRPRRGRIAVDGEVWFDAARGIDRALDERRVGFVPQDLLLLPHQSALENLRLGLSRAGAGGERVLQRAIEVLELGPVLAQRPPQLSGGERQRVALGRALASAPRLLVLDEPLASLDLPLRRRLLSYLARAREAFDVPLVLVSHDPTEVLALCDECARLARGVVVEVGPSRRVLLTAARESGAFENVLRGRAGREVGPGRVAIAPGVALQVANATAALDGDVLVALRAEDVLIATGELPAISARNVLPARIADLRSAGEDAWIDAEVAPGVLFVAHLTPGAVRELDLAPGRAVRLVIKAQSCRLLSA